MSTAEPECPAAAELWRAARTLWTRAAVDSADAAVADLFDAIAADMVAGRAEAGPCGVADYRTGAARLDWTRAYHAARAINAQEPTNA